MSTAIDFQAPALSVTKIYLKALAKLTTIQSYAPFARETQRELGRRDVNIGEFISPIVNLPKEHLTDCERQWRQLAEQEIRSERVRLAQEKLQAIAQVSSGEDEGEDTVGSDLRERCHG